MKKLLALICMITCILGLTGCGGEATYTELESTKIAEAEKYAVETLVPLLEKYSTDIFIEEFAQHTAEELEYVFQYQQGILIDGYAFTTALNSFNSTIWDIGGIVEIGEAKGVIDDKQIIVTVDVKGAVGDAQAEVIVSNDLFLRLESAALNPIEDMGDLMKKAALNTLIGMGTVFGVLILIIFIISAFGFIPKIQKSFENRKAKKVETTGIDNAVAQITQQETEAELSDDMELVAVIAAAVAAYEGSASTDGFVVRSIRKARR
ncbi:MAG: OadG family protein [Lachnospiraceae bacterium]|nr:OadG family protein [Lachnospiraceae bacterium]